MTTSGYVELLVEELLEERFGPRPRRIIWQDYESTTREQQQRRRVLLGLEDQNGTE